MQHAVPAHPEGGVLVFKAPQAESVRTQNVKRAAALRGDRMVIGQG
jgi:hypothetical protein